eukprot:m.360108 g.360108  ORF g.360108 m.360108 type:complete len:195 (+) comp16635_c0_seq4:203-787(+)
MSGLLRGLLSGLGFASKRLRVGQDLAGNVYYTIPQKNPGRASPSGAPAATERRMVLPPSGNEFDFDQSTVPQLWASWLTGARQHPPTPDELAAEDHRRVVMAQRVQEFEERDRVLGGPSAAAVGEKGVYTNHASIKEFTTPQSSELPGTGAGGVFRPGQWTPGTPETPIDDTSVTAKRSQDDYEPEGWSPGGTR